MNGKLNGTNYLQATRSVDPRHRQPIGSIDAKSKTRKASPARHSYRFVVDVNGRNLQLSANGESLFKNESKFESNTFMIKRQSRAVSQQRGATKVTLDEQRFPKVEYQHQMLKPTAPKSHFTARAGSQTRTSGRVHATAQLMQNNAPTLDTLSGHTNFQSFMVSDAQ